LQQCKQEGCEKCKKLLVEIKAEVSFERKLVDKRIHDYLDQAEENRSYLNNTGFMEWYYSKYGFDKRFEFLVHDDLLFVVVWDHGKKVVVTCVAARTHIAGRSHLNKPKFNKLKTKKEKEAEVINI
jgi:hypothetical protein